MTQVVYQMVYEQYNIKQGFNDEEGKAPSSYNKENHDYKDSKLLNIYDFNTVLSQTINQQQKKFSTIPEKEINQILYDGDNIAEIFRDNSIALLKLISSNMDSQIRLLSLVTGARI